MPPYEKQKCQYKTGGGFQEKFQELAQNIYDLVSRKIMSEPARHESTIFTIGHSTRTFEQLVELLREHGVERLIDVRSVPRSRKNPQFNSDTLAKALPAAGIEYEHMPGLGGLRHPHRDSPNTGWENDSFRGYADFMQTQDFEHNLHSLMETANHQTVAIMCAEAVPWRCHRSLIADALQAHGRDVRHIMTPKRANQHKLTSFAKVSGTRVTYPATEAS
jgi:uncharacterized protein (DUF488 family)